MFKAIAIVGIWLGTGLACLRKGNDASDVAFFAMMCTIVVCFAF
jgi:hypothetical protein